MYVDATIRNLGEFGTYQKRLLIFVAIAMNTTYVTCVVLILQLATPPHRCSDQGINQTRYNDERFNNSIHTLQHTQSSLYTNFARGNASNQFAERCKLTFANGTKTKCSSWTYDTSNFDNTVITEFDWVCDHRVYRSHSFMAFMVGMLLGSFAGSLGDRFGRKITIFGCLAALSASSLSVLLTTGFYSFVTVQVIVAALGIPIVSASCSLGVELLIPSKRFILNIYHGVTGGIFFALLVGAAYLIRTWRYIQVFIAVANFAVLFWWWFIVESPRWLLIRGRIEEAEVALKYVACVNGVSLPESMTYDIKNEISNFEPTSDRVWHLCYPSRGIHRTVIICLVWFATLMIFYGLSLNAGTLHGNIYINCLFSAAAEIPPTLFVYVTVNRVGRKPLLCGGLIGAGLLCLASSLPIVITEHGVPIVTVCLAMLGKAFAMVAFTLMYMYTIEFYPTSIRSAILGLCSVVGRIGSIISPYITNIGDFLGDRTGQIAPLIIFGSSAILVGLLAILLPETTNMRLHDLIEESGNFGRDKLVAENIELATRSLCENKPSTHALINRDEKDEEC